MEGCPSAKDVRLECGVVGRVPDALAVRVFEAPGVACAHVPGWALRTNPVEWPPG